MIMICAGKYSNRRKKKKHGNEEETKKSCHTSSKEDVSSSNDRDKCRLKKKGQKTELVSVIKYFFGGSIVDEFH